MTRQERINELLKGNTILATSSYKINFLGTLGNGGCFTVKKGTDARKISKIYVRCADGEVDVDWSEYVCEHKVLTNEIKNIIGYMFKQTQNCSVPEKENQANLIICDKNDEIKADDDEIKIVSGNVIRTADNYYIYVGTKKCEYDNEIWYHCYDANALEFTYIPQREVEEVYNAVKFSNVIEGKEKPFWVKRREMTIAQIEELLGFRIKIVEA